MTLREHYLLNWVGGGLDGGDHGALPEILGRDEHKYCCNCDGCGDDNGPDEAPDGISPKYVPRKTFIYERH